MDREKIKSGIAVVAIIVAIAAFAMEANAAGSIVEGGGNGGGKNCRENPDVPCKPQLHGNGFTDTVYDPNGNITRGGIPVGTWWDFEKGTYNTR